MSAHPRRRVAPCARCGEPATTTAQGYQVCAGCADELRDIAKREAADQYEAEHPERAYQVADHG